MTLKKIISYILTALVVFFVAVALLGIWDIIDLEDVIGKMLLSLLVIFAASAVILFIFSVLMKDSGGQNKDFPS